MDKKEVFQHISRLAQEGLVTKEELIEVYLEATEKGAQKSLTRQSRLSTILYFIGGTIVFLGIIILIGQNWHTLNDLTKILVTLGSALAAFYVGVLFSRYEKLDTVAQSFYFISGLVAPIGLNVTFDIAGWTVTGAGTQSFIAAILFTMYLTSYIFLRKIVFMIFSISFGTWLFFSFSTYLIDGNPALDTWRVAGYRCLIAALTYIFLGYYWRERESKVLSDWLYGFGVMGFLGAALALGGWSPQQNIFWELIFPGLVFGIIFLSVYLKNKSFLVFGALYLMAYIIKITSEYFSQSLGWPLALVLAGFMLMGIGYFAFYLNQKYIKS
ncbi:MAG: hypothetical protein A3D10_08335 [Omnitrophica WOR_2 bacterium RIFCSPHIGHO2_02_FULL_48_11]|nr:MAG: hypothetical protein A3D10_08335 [Omnitrophica WOR_2 bacterium RIFCSPHIGHO2_02_FULL_48_11]